jgi:hypothetical protein
MSEGYDITDGVISKSLVAETDFNALAIGTNGSSVSYPKFRIWFTKGESYKGYQPYGKSVDVLYQPSNVISPITEERLTNMEHNLDSLSDIDFNTLLGVITND